MKFWKPILLTTAFFASFTSILLYSSCEKDACVGVTCANGGSCSLGACKCPTGFEGPTCATPSVSRFVGYYAGFTTCNNGAQTIDTVFISPVSLKMVNSTYVVQKSHVYDVLVGTISSDESTYSIVIPDKNLPFYYKKYHVTLQSDNKLIMDTYERDYTTPGDTVINHCIFTGFKVN